MPDLKDFVKDKTEKMVEEDNPIVFIASLLFMAFIVYHVVEMQRYNIVSNVVPEAYYEGEFDEYSSGSGGGSMSSGTG